MPTLQAGQPPTVIMGGGMIIFVAPQFGTYPCPGGGAGYDPGGGAGYDPGGGAYGPGGGGGYAPGGAEPTVEYGGG